MSNVTSQKDQRELVTADHQEVLRTLKQAAVYLRTSTPEQNPGSQLHDLRQLATQRGFEIVEIYSARSAVLAPVAQSSTVFWQTPAGVDFKWY